MVSNTFHPPIPTPSSHLPHNLLAPLHHPRPEPLHIRRIHQIPNKPRRHHLTRLHQRQMPPLHPLLLRLLSLPTPLLLRPRIVRLHLLLTRHRRLIQNTLHTREHLLARLGEWQLVGGDVVWRPPARFRGEVDVGGGGGVDGFDEAGDGERGEHVACSREEEGEFRGVYAEEAGLEVGGCG